MENSLSRQILLSILGLAILVVAVVGVSYAIFSTTLSGSKINTLSSGTINMSYVEVSNGISIVNAMPMSDEEGKKLVGNDYVFDFVVSSNIAGVTTVDYEVVAEKVLVNGALLADSDVKIYLEKMVGDQYVAVPLTSPPQAFKANGVETDLGSHTADMILYRGSFTNTEAVKTEFSEKFRLRMWLSDEAVIDDVSRTFQIKVNVNGKVL